MKKMNKVAMAIAAAVLLIAAFFKIKQVLTEPILSEGFWESRDFYIIQIPLIVGLGIWMVCGLFRKAAWLLGILAFISFSIDTAYKVISDSASCGCFGAVEVNPWITLLAINMPVIILLLVFRPTDEKLFPPPWPKFDHFVACALPTFMLLGLIIYTTTKYEPPAVTEDYEVVTTDSWIGEPLPMLDYVNISDNLREGLSVIFFYHFDCPNCRESIPVYNQMCDELAGDDQIKFAFIEMPPYGNPQDDPVPTDTQCMKGKLSEDKKFYTPSPLVIITMDGIVTGVWQVEVPKSIDEILESTMGN